MTNSNHQQQSCGPCILVTGGAGYVGSHTILLLLQQDYRVIVIDNCSNTPMCKVTSCDANGNVLQDEMPESLCRVEQLANRKMTRFCNIDLVSDKSNLERLFRQYDIKAVIHFAALKSVSESIEIPLEYYSNNIVGTINLLNVMKLNNCRRLIFSSSATVYGLPQYLPVDEKHQAGLNILNPYGRTKYMIEQILIDLCSADLTKSLAASDKTFNKWEIISLRYFNPVGAHPSGYIGEHTQGTPNNLMPYVSQVSIGKREKLYVFGNDFDTIDGTGVRDFIHIMDLAAGHIQALSYLFSKTDSPSGTKESRYKIYNLGTGTGYSVLEVVKMFELVNGVKVPYEVTIRRPGDAGSVYADPSLANRDLNWRAKYSLEEMCRDTYKWQSNHPDGFKSPRSLDTRYESNL